MKILYAIQGTGNGHVSRAREIIPHLKKHGELDLLISGTHAEVGLEDEVKYQFNGFGFVFGNKGGVDFKETWNRFHSTQFIKDVKNLPVKDYDLIINDFNESFGREKYELVFVQNFIFRFRTVKNFF